MEIQSKKKIIIENIKKYKAEKTIANDVILCNTNDVILCNTDEELLNLILNNMPNYWLNNYVLTLEQFVDFFGEYFEKYRVYTTGEHSLYGHHKGYAFGDATLYVYNDYELYACQKATVYAYTQSEIIAYDYVKSEAHNLSRICMFGDKCYTEYFDESVGHIYNGEAKSHDKSNITLISGILTASDYSTIRTVQGGCKKITAMDNCKLELYGSPCVDCYNRCIVKAYDFSEVTCHNGVCIESYNHAQSYIYDLSSCITHDTSIAHIKAAKCVKLMDLSIGYNYCDVAIQMDVCGYSYLYDMTDTFTQVQNNATIKWGQSGKVFTNQKNLN